MNRKLIENYTTENKEKLYRIAIFHIQKIKKCPLEA